MRPNPVDLLLAVILLAWALAGCSRDAPTGVVLPMAPPFALESVQELQLATFDGSGQVTEPDIAFVPAGWRGQQYWLAAMPYPGGNEDMERPSVWASADGVAFIVPAGAANPVAGTASDPDILVHADSLVLSFRYYGRGAPDRVVRMASADGVVWGAQEPAFTAPENAALSPSVTYRGDTAFAFAIDASGGGCGGTTTTARQAPSSRLVMRTLSASGWSAPVASDLVQPGFVPWHVDAQWEPALGGFVALYNAFPVGTAEGCGNGDVFAAVSRDGLHWDSFAQPLIARGVSPWAPELYKATFLYDSAGGNLRVWFSAHVGGQWHLGLASFRQVAPLPLEVGLIKRPARAAA